jgi:hypothetical protein
MVYKFGHQIDADNVERVFTANTLLSPSLVTFKLTVASKILWNIRQPTAILTVLCFQSSSTLMHSVQHPPTRMKDEKRTAAVASWPCYRCVFYMASVDIKHVFGLTTGVNGTVPRFGI